MSLLSCMLEFGDDLKKDLELGVVVQAGKGK